MRLKFSNYHWSHYFRNENVTLSHYFRNCSLYRLLYGLCDAVSLRTGVWVVAIDPFRATVCPFVLLRDACVLILGYTATQMPFSCIPGTAQR